jgi:hypothetical protein
VSWLKTLLSGRPHFVIGDPRNPYLLRWYLLPRNPWVNLYLHKFLRDDDDRALHDHPWWFVSLLLRGAYREVLDSGSIVRRAGSIGYRPATHRHRVVLLKVPTWTLILTGPKVRTWGFWCPKGFVPWHEFTKPGAAGEVGRGCEE